jgi:hypothetical protein
MHRSTRPAWLAVIWAVAVCWIAIDAQKPPAALPADARADVFAAGRARLHVEAIARAPHPIGSAEAEYVRRLLVQKLDELGLTCEIQAPHKSDSPVRNVIARLKGQGPSDKKSLMLCAHFDSVATGPGAADNASGVAVVLETLRALRAKPPLDRDVIVLFDDGEEVGLNGSRLFVAEHPWAKDVGVVLNFDARGNSGPSIMFETSEGNGWLIDQYSQAAPHPLATSLSMAIYKLMPNSTDFTTFKAAGMAGLNFAFIGGIAYYHSPQDTPANLDPRTLQHQGENAMVMARRLGGLDLDNLQRADVIYASILGRVVLSYPMGWAMPLAFAAAVSYAGVVVIGVRAKRLRLIEVTACAGLFVVAVAISVLAVGVLWNITRGLLERSSVSWQKHDAAILFGFAILTAMLTLVLARWSGRRRSLTGLCLGAFSWWVVFSLATAHWLPGASYLFVWPTLFGLLGLCVSILSRPDSVKAQVAAVLCSTPSLVLLPPLISVVFDVLSAGMTAPIVVFLVLMVPIVSLVVLFLGTMVPILGPLIAHGPGHGHASLGGKA